MGSSEILESLLGKYKRIQGTHSKGGMTGSLLNIGAAVSRKTSDTIRKALASVPVAAVGRWIRENLGLTISAQQALAFRWNKNSPQTPNFSNIKFLAAHTACACYFPDSEQLLVMPQRTPGLFITGTDTGVGKTYVAALIRSGWRPTGARSASTSRLPAAVRATAGCWYPPTL